MMRVTIRPSADHDLDDIFDWIAEDDPDAAERYVRRLVDVALSLCTFPERGPLRPEIGEGVRSLTIGRYLVLYRTEGNTVEIVRFVHGARDLRGIGI